MVYDDRHRTFLQAIMHGGAVLDQEALALCVRIFNERISVSTVAALINDKLAPLAMSIKSGICEMTGDTYWSVVGTSIEEGVTIPTEFSEVQRAFLRTIYSEIITAADGCISSMDCLNLAQTLDIHKLTVGDADIFLKDMIKRNWLYTKDGYIYMGVRSIVELMPYFRETYQDNFHNCFLCKQVIFHGQKCENCDKIFHNYCLARYARMHKDSKCPQCKQSLDTSSIPDEVIASQAFQTEEEPMEVENGDTSAEIRTRKSKKRSKIAKH